MKKELLIIYLLAIAVSANTIWLNVENFKTNICVTKSDHTSQTCNQTTYVELDGTEDHVILLTGRKALTIAGVNNSGGDPRATLELIDNVVTPSITTMIYFVVIMGILYAFATIFMGLFKG